MTGAQTALLSVMRLRAQAIQRIATWAPQAASKSTSKDAVYNISVGTSELYGSDVNYKTFVVTDIAKALNARIPAISGSSRSTPGRSFRTWAGCRARGSPTQIGAQLSTSAANANNDQPGLHGHSLTSVSVGGTTSARRARTRSP